MSNLTQIKSSFLSEGVQKRFREILGEKAQGFISSVLQIVNGNNSLAKADPATVLNSAVTAAVLDLPINQNLGFAWIVPYKGKAQFQMGWKGYVQLAMRTGQYKRINVVSVYENQFQSFDALTEELKADFKTPGEGKVVGYAAYFSLVNGFEKLSYWTMEEVKKHAKKYSQTYGRKYNGKLMRSPWNDEDTFDAMAKKTVLKNTLAKWGIMSIELQTGILADQSVQKQEGEFDYIDNKKGLNTEEIQQEKERDRLLQFIEESESIEQLQSIRQFISDHDLGAEYTDKEAYLLESKKS